MSVSVTLEERARRIAVGQVLNRLRAEHGYSTKQAASRAGLSRWHPSGWAGGQAVNDDVLESVLLLFAKTPQWLEGEVEEWLRDQDAADVVTRYGFSDIKPSRARLARRSVQPDPERLLHARIISLQATAKAAGLNVEVAVKQGDRVLRRYT